MANLDKGGSEPGQNAGAAITKILTSRDLNDVLDPTLKGSAAAARRAVDDGDAAVAVIVEMVYHIKLNEALGPQMSFAGVMLDTRGTDAWVGALLLLATGVGLFEVSRRQFVRHWGQVQEDIEAEIQRREGL